MTFVPPFAHSSHLVTVRDPDASRVCCILLWYTASVPQARERMPDLLRPLPAHADAACSTGHAGDPCSHIPVGGVERPAAPAGPPHMTRRNHARCDEAAPPALPAGARLPTWRVGSSSEDQLGLEGGEAETKASDGQGQS